MKIAIRLNVEVFLFCISCIFIVPGFFNKGKCVELFFFFLLDLWPLKELEISEK